MTAKRKGGGNGRKEAKEGKEVELNDCRERGRKQQKTYINEEVNEGRTDRREDERKEEKGRKAGRRQEGGKKAGGQRGRLRGREKAGRREKACRRQEG